jgi:anti-sigma factor RsiW
MAKYPLPAAKHPDRPSLEAFALGRLEAAEIPRIEEHLKGCPACTRSVQEAPDDDLVRLLQRPRLAADATGTAGPDNRGKPSSSWSQQP